MTRLDHEAVARRVADCLETHLREFGWEPYCYPSGEQKDVDASYHVGYSEVHLMNADGSSFVLTISQRNAAHD